MRGTCNACQSGYGDSAIGAGTMKKQITSKHAVTAPPPPEELSAPRQEREAPRPASQPAPRDGIVILCMTIVACAVAAMLYAQFSQTVPTAAASGLGVWALFLLIHKYVQKSQQVAQLTAELARSRPKPARPTSIVAPATIAREALAKSKLEASPAITKDAVHTAAPTAPAATAEETWPPRRDGHETMTHMEMPRASDMKTRPKDDANPPSAVKDAAQVAASSALPDGPVWSGRAVPPSVDGLRDQWAFRPRGESASLPGPVDFGAAHQAAPLTVESDLELVQRKIKALADEVNFGPALKSAPRPDPDFHAKATAEAIEDSIGALKAAAGNMRERGNSHPVPALGSSRPGAFADNPATISATLADVVIPATAQTIAASKPGPLFSAPSASIEPRLPDLPLGDFAAPASTAAPLAPRQQKSPIARAIEKNAIDMMLSPIVALQTNDVGHYDVAMRLRDGAGNSVAVSEAELQALDGEMAAQFDVARFNRAVQLVQRMEAKSRNGYLMTEITGTALSSRTFLEAFARIYEGRPKIAQQLVLTLAQEAVDAASPSARQSLRDMNSLGFRFALGKARHVRTDFAELAASGFAFVRIEAGALINGLQGGDRRVPAEELFQRAALAGLTIIATNVETALDRAALVASGVELGEGLLFGPPRAINLDAEGTGGRSAAA